MTSSSPSNQRLTELWSAYGNAIRGYILALVRDPGEADDLTQETFLRVIRKLDTLKDETKLSSWLYRIATNICHDRYRQISRRQDSVSLDAPVEDTSGSFDREVADAEAPSLQQLLEQSEMSACVQRYIEELPDPYRAAILLHDLEGMASGEIAEMLGCSIGAVKIRLHRARTRLKSALEDACSFSTDERGVYVCDPKPPALIPLSTISKPDAK
jgi:RNA polymerase sigma-70 factor (ECF subfamily)